MMNKDLKRAEIGGGSRVAILRHREICKRLQVSAAKLHDMVAKGVFPRGFKIIPNGRAVGWLEADVDRWILDRHAGERVESAPTNEVGS